MALTLCPSRAESPTAPQRSIGRNTGPAEIPAAASQALSGFDRPADGEDAFVLFAARRLGAPEPQGEDGELGAVRRGRVGGNRLPLDQVLESQAGDLGAAAAARGEGDEHEGGVAPVGEPIAGAGDDQPLEHVAGQRLGALAAARPALGAGGEAERAAHVRRRKRALEAEPAMEGRPQGEAPAHGRGGVRAAGAQPPVRPQRRLDRGGHAVRGVFGAAGGIVKVVGDEAQDEALGRRPGQGAPLAARDQASR